MNDESGYCRMIAEDFLDTHFNVGGRQWDSEQLTALAELIAEQRELIRFGVQLAHGNSHVLGVCVLCDPGRI